MAWPTAARAGLRTSLRDLPSIWSRSFSSSYWMNQPIICRHSASHRSGGTPFSAARARTLSITCWLRQGTLASWPRLQLDLPGPLHVAEALGDQVDEGLVEAVDLDPDLGHVAALGGGRGAMARCSCGRCLRRLTNCRRLGNCRLVRAAGVGPTPHFARPTAVGPALAPARPSCDLALGLQRLQLGTAWLICPLRSTTAPSSAAFHLRIERGRCLEARARRAASRSPTIPTCISRGSGCVPRQAHAGADIDDLAGCRAKLA